MTCEALEWKLLLTASIITLTRGRQWVAGAGSSHVFTDQPHHVVRTMRTYVCVVKQLWLQN